MSLGRGAGLVLIAVVINNLEAAKLDLLMAGADPSGRLLAAVVELRQRLDEFEGRLAAGALGPVPRAGAAPPTDASGGPPRVTTRTAAGWR